MTTQTNKPKPRAKTKASADKTAPRNSGVRGRPFPKGVSGNKAGRPTGSRHSVSLACENLIQGEGEEITRAVIRLAKSGDATCARLVFERLVPLRRGRPVRFSAPNVTSIADAAQAMSCVINELKAGTLTPEEAASVASVFETHRKVLEATELEDRLKRLEAALHARP